jgi:PAS domain S-box-containing protein
MEQSDGPLVDWRELAKTMPGGVGVQIEDEFVHVSEELATLVGGDADALIVADSAVTTLETEGLRQAREEGRWEGTVRVTGEERLAVTLSTTPSGAVIWAFPDPDPASARPGADGDDPRETLDTDPGFVKNVVDAMEDVLYVVDGDGDFAFWNQELVDRFGYDEERLPNIDPNVFLRPSDFDELPVDPADFVNVPDRHNVVDLVTSDGDTIPHELYGVSYTDETTGESYRVGIARDITERIERERRLKRQRDGLATLDRVNRILMETIQALIETSSRDAVERTVCERLATADRYRFAWVGERAFDGDRIVPRVTAGEDEGYVSEVTITDDDTETGQGPAGRAIATGTVQTATVDDPSFEPWRDAASERGIEGVAAVPLQYDGTVYGVLLVYATTDDAFSAREQTGFEVLGRTVGSVIRAARSRELLFADSIVELEFSLDPDGSLLPRLAAECDCEFDLDGYVATGDRWLVYLGVRGVDPGSVVEAAVADDRVDRARTVGEHEDGEGRVEFRFGTSSLLHTVIGAGASVTDATADPDGARLVVEVPASIDVPEVVEHVQRADGTADLRARRERDREVATVGRPGGLLDELTDRQREVLEAAYRAGYFGWPRESTAQEVADSLDLAAPTLHGHLRKAEQSVLGALFDDD